MQAADWVAVFVALGALGALVFLAILWTVRPRRASSVGPSTEWPTVDASGQPLRPGVPYVITDAGWEDVTDNPAFGGPRFSTYPADWPAAWRPPEPGDGYYPMVIRGSVDELEKLSADTPAIVQAWQDALDGAFETESPPAAAPWEPEHAFVATVNEAGDVKVTIDTDNGDVDQIRKRLLRGS